MSTPISDAILPAVQDVNKTVGNEYATVTQVNTDKTVNLQLESGELFNVLIVADLKLEKDDRVILAYLNNNPNYPIVIGMTNPKSKGMTDEQILEAIKRVDGHGSGLNADLLDGKHASDFMEEIDDSWDLTEKEVVLSSQSPVDLDGYITTGLYRILNPNSLNLPIQSIGTLEVIRTAASMIQFYYPILLSSKSIYMRKYASFASPTDRTPWYRIWHEGDQGAGSGLDADLLDGVDSGMFLYIKPDIPASADLNNYTTTGLYHQPLTANAASGTNYPEPGAGLLEVVKAGGMVYQRYTVYNSAHQVYVRTCYLGEWYPWNKLWNNNKDGAGSGLDADLLDGKHASDFIEIEKYTKGVRFKKDGVYIFSRCWGSITISASKTGWISQVVTLPFTFNMVDIAQGTINPASNLLANSHAGAAPHLNKNEVNIYVYSPNTSGSYNVQWEVTGV